MRTTIKRVPVWELPARMREGRNEAGFVDVTIEDAPAPSDADKLAFLRQGIEEADEDVRAGRVHDPDHIFAELGDELAKVTAR